MEENADILNSIRADLGRQLDTMGHLNYELWVSRMTPPGDMQQLLIDLSPVIATPEGSPLIWAHLSGRDVHLHIQVYRESKERAILAIARQGFTPESINPTCDERFLTWTPMESWGDRLKGFKIVLFFVQER